MKKIIIITSMLLFSSSFINAAEPKCDTRLSKLNPDCNFIGKGFKKMKDFSKKNKTIDQSYNNIKEKLKK